MKEQVITSIAWLGGMKYLGQIISWAVTILVIRILDPGDYGLMAMASVCVNFLVMISELGLGAAIVQKKELGQDQLGQVFGFILVSHVFLFFLLFLGADLVAAYYSEPRLIPVLQVLSLNFLLLALYVIPQSLITREMDFKRKSLVDLVATVSGVVITLALALGAYGVWALVWGTVLMHGVRLVGYNILSPFFSLPDFRFRGIRDFISFGAYTLSARVLWYFYSKSDILIGGRILGTQIIGIYSVALEFSEIPMNKFMPVVNQVAFPAYSRVQSDTALVASHFLKAARVASLLIFPVFWGMLVIVPEVFGWLLGDKWTDAIVPMQIICLIMPLRTLGTLVSPMLFGIGRVDVNLKYVAAASLIMPASFFVGCGYGIRGLCAAWVVGYVAVFLITLKLSLPLMNLSVRAYLSNISLAFFSSLVMVAAVWGAKLMLRSFLPLPLMACILIFFGVGIHCLFVFCAKQEAFREVWSLIPGNARIEAFMRKFLARA